MKRPAIFFDRDNTLIISDGYLGDPAAVTLVPGAADAIARARALGFVTVTFSNQSGVARGLFDESAVMAVNSKMEELLKAENPAAIIDRNDYCPYHPEAPLEQYRVDSDLRKPRPGMIHRAAEALALDLPRSWVVGDAPRDISAGQAAGCRTILFTDPSLPPSPSAAAEMEIAPDFSVATLKGAIDCIEREIGARRAFDEDTIDDESSYAAPTSTDTIVEEPAATDMPGGTDQHPPDETLRTGDSADAVAAEMSVATMPATMLASAMTSSATMSSAMEAVAIPAVAELLNSAISRDATSRDATSRPLWQTSRWMPQADVSAPAAASAFPEARRNDGDSVTRRGVFNPTIAPEQKPPAVAAPSNSEALPVQKEVAVPAIEPAEAIVKEVPAKIADSTVVTPVVAPVAVTPQAEETVTKTQVTAGPIVPTPTLATMDLAKLERLAESILQELRRRREPHIPDFSVMKLLAAVVQMLAIGALILSYFFRGETQPILLVALTLQVLTISLMMMGKQN